MKHHPLFTPQAGSFLCGTWLLKNVHICLIQNLQHKGNRIIKFLKQFIDFFFVHQHFTDLFLIESQSSRAS